MIVVTGATGQLGRLVVEQLLKTVPAKNIVAAVRDPAKAASLTERGVQVRAADYTKPDTLRTAFAGAEKVLLISSSEMGQRVAQHRAVIEAAQAAKVQLLGYTSILHGEASKLVLAKEHVETEALIKASKLPYVFLRNGWYNENYKNAIQTALTAGAVLGCAGEGRFSTASRADFAAAAVAVLTREGHAHKTYELAGDTAFTLTELAALIAQASGKPVAYVNLSEAEYTQKLGGFGLPPPIAAMLADSDAGAAKGELYDETRQLSALIGRPTIPMRETVAAVVKG